MSDSWSPIFSPGFHNLDLDQVRSLCVDADQFRNSKTRQPLFRHLETAVAKLSNSNVEGEIWLGGSFVRTKPDPRDLDVSLRIRAPVFEQGTPAQKAAINSFTTSYLSQQIDGYLHLEFPVTDPRHSLGLENYLYWKEQWGFDRNGSPQGIVVIQLNVP